jgi:hypothetical protein
MQLDFEGKYNILCFSWGTRHELLNILIMHWLETYLFWPLARIIYLFFSRAQESCRVQPATMASGVVDWIEAFSLNIRKPWSSLSNLFKTFHYDHRCGLWGKTFDGKKGLRQGTLCLVSLLWSALLNEVGEKSILILYHQKCK